MSKEQMKADLEHFGIGVNEPHADGTRDGKQAWETAPSGTLAWMKGIEVRLAALEAAEAKRREPVTFVINAPNGGAMTVAHELDAIHKTYRDQTGRNLGEK